MTYDVTQLYNELDLLEIRLNILDQYVDKFVIGQSTQTFSGLPKPLYFIKADSRWDKWRDKIIEVTIPPLETDDVFERTAFSQSEK
jgi:beta-1,4-mannosyl-glycoprotein beta-1,4-N-acetylglucosaminyltransferase